MNGNRHPEQDPAEGSHRTVERELDQPEKSTKHGEGEKSGMERDAEGQYVKTKKATRITASAALTPVL